MKRPFLLERVLGMQGVGKVFFGGILFFGVSWGTMVGCSSSTAPETTKPPAPFYCPNTVQEAVGAACTKEGAACAIGYACGAVPNQSHCTCTGGHFACTDSLGMPVMKGTDPGCADQGMGQDSQCPGSLASASGKACMTAGLLCYYTGAVCPENNGVANKDVCQCKGSPLAFECEEQACHPKSDASTPPPPDAGSGMQDATGGG
jgi:hypothetical protein